MKRLTIITIIVLCGGLWNAAPVGAWSVDTHRIITEVAIDNSILENSNGDYLNLNLGFQDGIIEYLLWKHYNLPVLEWLQEGSEKEDDVLPPRFMNHFHNPLKHLHDWGEAGLDDWYNLLPLNGLSSALWAHRDSNDWSWPRTRDYFYTALTASTEEQRQEYFARTFRGLGQQMHLLQDKAVPAHVRNDAHPVSRNRYGPLFEAWAKDNQELIVEFAQHPVGPMVNLHRHIGLVYKGTERFELTPIVQLTDTDTYDGTNPSAGLAIGLAEYTNANFFSEDTIFAAETHRPGQRHFFPHPAGSDTNLQNFIEQQLLPVTDTESGDTTFAISKTGGGEIIDCFVQPTYHTLDIFMDPIIYRTFYLSQRCYEDYARLLVPRAVGYSAALLDYFFRGRMDFKEIMVRRGSGFGINGIRLAVKNSTPPQADGQTVEPMAGGSLDLVCRYFDPVLEQYANKTIENVYEVHHSDDPINHEHVTIDVNWDEPIAFEAREVSFLLVYRGHLGYEYDHGVIGAKVPETVPSRIAYHVTSGSWPYGQDEIFIVLPDGTDPRRISPGDSPNPWYYMGAWSRDGRRLAFEIETCDSVISGGECPTDDYRRRVGIQDLHGQLFVIDTIVDVANAPDDFCATEWARAMHTPAFSPDGNRLVAINQYGPFRSALAVIDLAGGGPWRWVNDYAFWVRKDLRNPSLQVSPPSWSPVRDEIVYQIYNEPHPDTGVMTAYRNLYRINADGSANTRLTDDPYHNAYPSWSSDGEWVVFVSDRDIRNIWDIWIMDRHGANLRKVHDCRPSGCLRPTFSPDNRQIAFLHYDEVLVLDLLSGDPPQVVVGADDDRFNLSPVWSPEFEAPVADLSTSPAAIAPGQSAPLTWHSAHGDRFEIDQGIGPVSAGGTLMVRPTRTTTYTLTVLGLGGRATAAVTVRVEEP